MKTLFEELLRLPPGYAFPQLAGLGFDWRSAMLIRADNVADYFYMGNEQEVWDITRDFPTLAPPFPLMFIEWPIPLETRNETGLHRDPAGIEAHGRQGALVWATDAKLEDPFRPMYPDLRPQADLRWLLHIYPVMHMPRADPRPQEMGYVAMLWLDREGEVAVLDANHRVEFVFWRDSDKLVEFATRGFMGINGPLFLSLSFMNCRNVELVERGPGSAHPPTGRRNRHGAHTKFYTLKIDAIRKVLDGEGQAGTRGLSHALHICRGNFAHYTADAPLFGKYVGTYWRPMHVRGSAQAGSVVKDYQPEPPQTKETHST